ncbi:MAG TPA: selenium cofactor biosynthesis protein YqeC [Symbiobacteriaceae bacterium]|nr:selenium cofactor biosynthesis protein YqeC [Symbiobacteriaceae bacterium]
MLLEALGAVPGDVISLVGGGGKTSLAHLLVREAVALGLRPLFTVTTKMFTPDLPPDLWVAGPPTPEGKLTGLSFDEVERLRSRAGLLVVEADGAAGRALKFPQAHEPVIPPCTTIVLAVAGASVVGKPLSPNWVHRAPDAAAYLGRGGPITATAVARILWNPDAATRGRPAAARVVPVINQADSPDRLAAARAVGRALLRLGAPQVLLTTTRSHPSVVEQLIRG